MKLSIKKLIAVVVGIVLNISGRLIAQAFGLPIWLDMTGTFVAADIAGFPGALIAALSANIFFGASSPIRLVYCFVGVIAAALITYFVKKGYLLNPLRAALASFWLGIICTIASTPLNLIFFGGYTGNSWGDTLVDMLLWYDVPHWISAMAGQAIVEVVDKQICVLIACLITLSSRLIRKHKDKKAAAPKAAALIAAAGIALSGASLMFGVKTSAESGDNGTSTVQSEAESNSDYLNFVEKIYDNANGMISSEANVICETDDGYIWIGSYAGLTRYDGNQFEFIREGGLVNVVGMMTDSKGRLWIGTNDAGIARYENGHYTYFTEKDGLPTNSVRCFAEDNEGNVYVGTSEKICKFDASDNIEISSLDINFVKYMTVYRDMLVVMDNNGCVYAIDGDRELKLDSAGMGDYFYYCLAPTSKGLMIGTETGELFSAEITTGKFVLKEKFDIGADQISAIFEDSSNRIWIAQRLETGYIGHDGKYRRVKFKGFDSSIVYFHEDYQGNLWLASSHYGVMKLSESPFLDVFEKAEVSPCVVNAVEYYGGTYICGTDNGLVVFDKNGVSNKFTGLRKMTEGCRVRCLYADIDGSLWVCTYSGLFRYSPDGSIRSYTTETDKVTSDRFRCIIRLSDDTVAAGTSNGINFFKDGELTTALDSDDGLSNTQILCLAEGPDGSLWAGSDGSGIYVISEGGLVKNYTAEDGLSSEVVLRIVPHEDGFLIVTSNALCHMDSAGNISRLSDFPYFNNYDIIIDGEKAYITCSAGIYETTVSGLCSGGDINCKLYSAGEGLLSGLTANSWNYLTDDGKLFLCSNSGVIVFSSIAAREETGMKYGIVSAECDGKPLEKENEYTYKIPPGAKDINLHASVRNYAFSDVGVRFFVKELESSPRVYSWNEIEHVRIFKPNSPQYSVCLQIIDSTGERVLQETTYTLRTEMKPWEEPGFQTYLIAVCTEAIILALVSLIGIVFFVTRKNELEKVQTELEEKIKDQTSELVAKQNTIKALFIQTVTALSEAVDAKDRYTSGHSKRVAEYSRMIAARMGKTKEEQEEIYRAGLLHDVGKIRVPVEIINKAGKLTDEEYDIIKIHPITGYHILRGISGSRLIAISAKYHHERYDGRGYPNGLEGDRIPEAARILGVADSYDAMTSTRSYRKALPQEVVRAEIEKGKGTQFDPAIADIMLRMIDEDTEYTMKQGDFSQKRILTVDDEIINSKLIARIMKDEPMYEIVSATSGRQAIEILDEQHFDLIMLDVNMPEMDGLETLRLIRKKHQTPVVLMTGDKSLDTSVGFAELGCDDYVTKPFLAPLLKEIVHNMTECININE